MQNTKAINGTGEFRGSLKSRVSEEVSNRVTAGWFAGCMVFIMLMFTIIRWTRVSFKGYESKGNSRGSALLRGSVAVTRSARRLLLRAVPGFTSAGHATVVLIYTIVSVVICFVRVPHDNALGALANRTGWLSFLNLALITFLALRYSPLSFLTGYSYERLIVLHRISGYATIFWAVIHTILFSVSFNKRHELTSLGA